MYLRRNSLQSRNGFSKTIRTVRVGGRETILFNLICNYFVLETRRWKQSDLCFHRANCYYFYAKCSLNHSIYETFAGYGNAVYLCRDSFRTNCTPNVRFSFVRLSNWFLIIKWQGLHQNLITARCNCLVLFEIWRLLLTSFIMCVVLFLKLT